MIIERVIFMAYKVLLAIIKCLFLSFAFTWPLFRSLPTILCLQPIAKHPVIMWAPLQSSLLASGKSYWGSWQGSLQVDGMEWSWNPLWDCRKGAEIWRFQLNFCRLPRIFSLIQRSWNPFLGCGNFWEWKGCQLLIPSKALGTIPIVMYIWVKTLKFFQEHQCACESRDSAIKTS